MLSTSCRIFVIVLCACVSPVPAADTATWREALHTALVQLARPAPTVPAPAPARNLRHATPAARIQWRANGTPARVHGECLEPALKLRAGNAEQQRLGTAQRFLQRYRGLLRLREPVRELRLRQAGPQRLRFGRYWQGLPVWPEEVGVHFDAVGNVTDFFGAYRPTPRRPLTTRPTLDAAQAKALVDARYPQAAERSAPTLLFYAPTGEKIHLAWQFEVEVDLATRLLVTLDAHRGAVLSEINRVHAAGTVTGGGIGLSGAYRQLPVYEENGVYFLADATRPMFAISGAPEPEQTRGSIMVFDWENQPPEFPYPAPLIRSTRPDTGFLAEGVSAYFNLGRVYDYFYHRHGRNSLDDAGLSLLAMVRVGSHFNNAFWNGYAMFLGDALPYAASLDVIAHELTHGVVVYSANLIPVDQSGALHEAIADAFGEFVQAYYADGRADWDVGGGPLGEVFRNMRDPARYEQPAHMSRYVYLPIYADNGGIHVNSGIINHALYLLAEGLPEAVGIASAERILYHALTRYLLRNSRFIDARLALSRAAADLFGAEAPEVTRVREAFDAVGITATDPATPQPLSFEPVTAGPDATLFACVSPFGTVHVCRFDPNLGDTRPGILTSEEMAAQRISVRADGRLAAFVNANYDVCLLNVTDGRTICLGLVGEVHAVALSPDARRFAFVPRDGWGQPEKRIMVLDLDNSAHDRIYDIKAPSLDGGDMDTIRMVDSLMFNADGSGLIYDAENQVRAGEDGLWAIYSLTLDSGIIHALVEPHAGLDIGFPSLARTSDNFLVYQVYDIAAGEVEVRTRNLSSGRSELIQRFRGDFTIPAYTGDDGQVVFMYPDATASLGFSLVAHPLAADRLTPQGEPQVWLADGAFSTLYRSGDYLGPQPGAGFFDLTTGILRVEVALPADPPYVQADLQFVAADATGMLFMLLDYEVLAETPAVSGTYFEDGSVFLPRVAVNDSDGNTEYWDIALSPFATEEGLAFRLSFDLLQPSD